MPIPTLNDLRNWVIRAVITSAVVVVIVAVAVYLLFSDRPLLDDIDWPPLPADEAPADAVTMTWFGVSTLLFDDGNTQILIDGFFSRPSIADIIFDMPVKSDASQVNYVMDEFRLRRLAAIIPVHSHFDHAMDIGAIANRSSASILGSETTAQIARGAGVPDDQIMVAASNVEYTFGDFRITLIDSVHAPIAWGGSVPFGGTVDAPLELPAPVSAWREGGSYSIVVAHDQGTTLVQGSAGFLEGTLDEVRADVVMLGVWGLSGLGRDYTEKYWQSLVTATGAKRVMPVHFGDYTRPFGEIKLSPRLLDDFGDTARWLDEVRQVWDTGTKLQLPEFGKPIRLYPQASPEA
jgi:L-ascorbate metabolism protein UlaG (beta-lactamase superfamily)